MATTRTLKLACWDYDRTRAIIDGRVHPPGIAFDVSVVRPREAFTRMLAGSEFDLAEMSLSSFVRLVAQGDQRFVGLPVALSRMFRHSCIYVRDGSGIRRPQDLKGRAVGAAQLDSTGLVFAKGMLTHEYNVLPTEIRWFVGGLETPADMSPPKSGHGDVMVLGKDESVTAAFARGRIDAIISNHIPSPFFDAGSGLIRLFPDFKTVEKDYFRRTGIFPIMHVLVLRRELHLAEPDLAKAIYDAFCEAKELAVRPLYDTDALRLTLPWLIDHLDEARAVFGPDTWLYGAKENAKVWGAISRYLVEQKLADRIVPTSELFVCG
ncbi:MAG TPA: PhnD/SsuA/transferrin family substrate-binding protein [Pseudolabrys sp.]|nr:PhnD/SsuA/transferrin family substrate-binding protein [Pseudolabrys sp.]